MDYELRCNLLIVNQNSDSMTSLIIVLLATGLVIMNMSREKYTSFFGHFRFFHL